MFLEIRDLKISYKVNNVPVQVVRGVNLDIKKGECVGLVGESGCGKTTVGLSITKLIPENKGVIDSGRILLEGRDLLKLEPGELRNFRGKRISYVFQEPFSSLNPVFTIYDLKKESGKYKLFDTRIESSTIDDLFKAFRNNPNIPSKEKFVNKLKTKLTAKMELKLEF